MRGIRNKKLGKAVSGTGCLKIFKKRERGVEGWIPSPPPVLPGLTSINLFSAFFYYSKPQFPGWCSLRRTRKRSNVLYMVIILDGNSGIGAHVGNNLCYSICFRHFIRSKAVTNRIFFPRKDIFSFMRAQHVLSYHLI